MARVEITMPQLGESVTEGTITQWLKQVGDRVEEDELLFEVSTDKVDSEVPSPSAGWLAEIVVAEGDTVEVGAILCHLVTEESELGATGAATPSPAPSPEPEPAAPAPSPPQVAPAQPAPATTAAQPTARVETPSAPSAPPAAASGSPGVLLSPVVRRLVHEHGLDPSRIEGSGEGGRITRSDVLRVIERQQGGPRPSATSAAPQDRPPAAPAPPAPPAPRSAAAAGAPAAPAAAALTPAVGERDEVVPFSNIRRRTAEHMTTSLSTSAHVTLSMEIDFENVERVRAAHKARWRADEGFGLTYLPFIARAVCDAIKEFPHVNARVDGDSLVVHHYVNLGIAVDLDFQGLVVPVVRNCDAKRLRQIAREIRDLASRARSKRLVPDEIMGGTFTITNPGPYGTAVSNAVINQPQVAILTTDGVHKKPVVVEAEDGDAIAVHHVGSVSQTFDHRAFDGAYSAAFLQRLKAILETRDWKAELA